MNIVEVLALGMTNEMRVLALVGSGSAAWMFLMVVRKVLSSMVAGAAVGIT